MYGLYHLSDIARGSFYLLEAIGMECWIFFIFDSLAGPQTCTP